jgi:hypothetical protein
MSQKMPSNENENVQISTEETDRRAFLRNAAVVAGAAAATGLAATSSSAASLSKADLVARAGTATASFDPNYKVDIYHIQKVIEQILNETGCPTCGLVGIDLRLGLDRIINVEVDVPVNVTMEQHF